MLGVAVFGATGRMGGAVTRIVVGAPDMQLAGAVTEAGHRAVGEDAGLLAGLPPVGVVVVDDPVIALGNAAVAIDFTLPQALEANLQACVNARCPMVIGTTGLTAVQQQSLISASAFIPLLYGRNMSIGVNVLTELVRQAAQHLGGHWDVEITEAHHRYKVDAPSGTALQLGEAVASARGQNLAQVAVHGRSGHTGPRSQGEIGLHAIRAGQIVGDHSVQFVSDAETITLQHHAASRDVFASGAVQAARWLVTQSPGLYSMHDMLGLA